VIKWAPPASHLLSPGDGVGGVHTVHHEGIVITWGAPTPCSVASSGQQEEDEDDCAVDN